MSDLFKKSENGTKAAWKGFSSQTSYIAYRLMFLDDSSEFFPEKIEDLMLKKDGLISELVQVKNLTADLSLSHLSPKEPDSFFRRALLCKQESPDVKLKIVSFGNIGKELNRFIKKDVAATETIESKLVNYGFTLEESKWLLERLEIEKISEEEINKKIFEKLVQTFQTAASPQVAFEVLISYVSNLSRRGGKTTKDIWEIKLHDIAMEFAALKGYQAQYGRSILPLFEYKDTYNVEKLREEYLLGVNAKPQHIRNGLDLSRIKWINKITQAFEVNNVVIIRGASGQGKSSVAYRYLIDHYPENRVFCVEQVSNAEQAADIVTALNGLSKKRDSEIIVYIDVLPYDKEWFWILEQIIKQGTQMKLLVTIREEDFRRTAIDFNVLQFSEIEISLDKEEAYWIYQQYPSPNFLSFEDAWNRFGEEGPLMEFIYMLNQSSTLRKKLKSQIDKIILNEIAADSWMKVLRVISYAGRNSIPVNLRKILKELPCEQTEKMLYTFENEYLLRKSADGKSLEPLHALRAKLLFEILRSDEVYPEDELLITTLKCIDNHAQILIINYFYDNELSEEIISRIGDVTYDSWNNYSSALSGMLWVDAYNFNLINRDTIAKGDQLLNNNFIMLGIPDVTGYLEVDSNTVLQVISKISYEKEQMIRELIKCLKLRKIDYYYTDRFLNKTYKSLPALKKVTQEELCAAGFGLFWLALRGKFIEPCVEANKIIQEITTENLNEALDLLVGIQFQNWPSVYGDLVNKIKQLFCEKYNIIYLDDSKKELSATFIVEIFSETSERDDFNDVIVSVLSMLRRLYTSKSTYHVKAIGHNINKDIILPDTEKIISYEKLPFSWVTELNAWVRRINSYSYHPENWDEYLEKINHIRTLIYNSTSIICKGIDCLYKKNGDLKIFTLPENVRLLDETMKAVNVDVLSPKCVMDKFGLRMNKNRIELPSQHGAMNQISINSGDRFTTEFNHFCASYRNFLKFKHSLILSRKKNAEQGHEEHLSLINIIETVSRFRKMQSSYEEIFIARVIDSNIIGDDENEQLLLLATAWEYLKNNNIRRERSIIYNCNQFIKKKRGQVNQFFNLTISKMHGVKSLDQSTDKIKILIVDVEAIDDFCSQMFNEFRAIFPNATTLSLDSLFIEEQVQEIIVTPMILGNIVQGGFRIRVSNFLISDNIEQFLNFREPILDQNDTCKQYESLDQKSPMFSMIKIMANLQGVPLIFRHSTSIIKYLKSHDAKIYINDYVFEKWLQKGMDFQNKVYFEILEDLRIVREYQMDTATDSLNEMFTCIEEGINILINSREELMITDNYEEVEQTIESIRQMMVELFGNVVIE